MLFRTKTNYPHIAAGEILVLDDSNPANVVYRGVTDKNFWVSKDVVESGATIVPIVSEEKFIIEEKANLTVEELAKVETLEAEVVISKEKEIVKIIK